MSIVKWNYKMFNNAKIKYSCFIQSDSGDNICKMLRDDAPNNAIQEQNAKLIAAAPQMLEALLKLQDVINRAAAQNCVHAIETDEVNMINTAIAKAVKQ